jgi:hypothetical protein
MRTYPVAALLSVLSLTVVMCMPAWGEVPGSVKINPTAVQYPLAKNSQYLSTTSDPYQMSFGVRRWLRPLRMTQDPMHEQILRESVQWFQRFGGYGVLGHGEDVFTRQGAAFRRQHRGH